MLVPKGTLVMVVDGAYRAVYRNDGEALAPVLTEMDVTDRPVPRTSELGADREGRRFESASSRRGGYEGTDFHQQAEDQFALESAVQLNALTEGGGARLILIAAPRVLGVMRPLLGRSAQAALTAEIAKDYARRPARDIAELLVKFEP